MYLYDNFIRKLNQSKPRRTQLGLVLLLERDVLNEARTQEICTAIENNTTCTYLCFSRIEFEHPILEALCNALAVNKTLTMIDFHENQKFNTSLRERITAYLKRNRQLALLAPLIVPVRIPNYCSQLTGTSLFDLAISKITHRAIDQLYSLISFNPRLLIQSSFVNQMGEKTLLMHAIEQGQVDCVKLLLKWNTSPNFVLKTESVVTRTPLGCAVSANQLVIAELLLKAGADINALCVGQPVFHFVRSAEMANLLLKYHTTLGTRPIFNNINRQFLGLIPRRYFKEYSNLVLSTLTLKQGQRNTIGFFASFPNKAVEKIIKKCVDTTIIDDETKKTIIRGLLNPP